MRPPLTQPQILTSITRQMPREGYTPRFIFLSYIGCYLALAMRYQTLTAVAALVAIVSG